MTINEKVRPTLGRLHQLFAVFSCALLLCIYGISLVWPSYSISMLNSLESPLTNRNLTDTDTALLASLPNLGAITITIPAGYFIERFGTKKCGIIIGIPMILAWLIQILSTTTLPIFAARFLVGVSGGFGMLNVSIFVADVAEAAFRGVLSTSLIISLTTGMLISYILGASFTYRVINIIVMTMSILYTVAICCIPESPMFLMRNKKEKEAARSLAWYRGANADSEFVKESLNVIKSQLNEKNNPQHDENQDICDPVHKDGEDAEKEKLQQTQEFPKISVESRPLTGWQFLRKSPSSQRALCSVIVLFLLQTFMGMAVVTTFAGEIFTDAAPGMSANACSIVIGVFTVIGNILAMFTIEKIGRKILMIVTSLIIMVCLAILAILMTASIGPGWLSAILLCMYVVIYSMGPGTIPFVWTADLFLPEVRSFSVTVCMVTYSLLITVCLAIFPPLKTLLGMNGIFFIFSASSLIIAIYTALVFPETKGLTAEEVQIHFGAKRR